MSCVLPIRHPHSRKKMIPQQLLIIKMNEIYSPIMRRAALRIRRNELSVSIVFQIHVNGNTPCTALLTFVVLPNSSTKDSTASTTQQYKIQQTACMIYRIYSELILGLRPANERRRYFVTTSLIGWVHAWNQPCISYWSINKTRQVWASHA